MFVISALLIGLFVALNPCQLAINISALTYLHHHSEVSDKLMKKGSLYILGRSTTYIVMGLATAILLQQGSDIEIIKKWTSKGEEILPYILLLIGAYLIYRVFHHHDHHGDDCHNCGKTIQKSGPFGALTLGLMLAFAFCPETAIMYFGMLIPLTLSSPLGWLAPIAFAIGAALPVAIMTYFFSKATQQVYRFEKRFSHFQQWVNALMGSAFIITGIILLIA